MRCGRSYERGYRKRAGLLGRSLRKWAWVLVCRLGYRMRGGAMGAKARLGGREETLKRAGPVQQSLKRLVG